ncbi:MAG: cobaltochelatase subunit CobN [Pseudomonadota bacterium]
MHLLASTTATIEDLAEPIDLRQPPAPLLAASFTDSDLLALAAAWKGNQGQLPDLRLARLKDLRHPMSVDLWLDRTAHQARVILVRVLGGLDWWRYGCERLSALARARGIVLALLPGEDQDDRRLAELSTLPRAEWETWLGYFRQGGPDNMGAVLTLAAARADGTVRAVPPPRPIPAAAPLAQPPSPGDTPRVLVLFYRSLWLAGDTAPIDVLCAALAERGLAPRPVFVSSLKDPAAQEVVRDALAREQPHVVITTTAFSAGDAMDLFPPGGPILLQAIPATTQRDAWARSPRGLAASDLAMHVVLPELDGRVLAGALSFKDPDARDEALVFAAARNRPEPEAIAHVAERAVRLARLRETPRAARRLAIVLPDYPGQPGRTGYAVGLDVPESARILLGTLGGEGYTIAEPPADARSLMDALGENAGLSLADYAMRFAGLPEAVRTAVSAAWGAPEADPELRDGAFWVRSASYGHAVLALAPDRGRSPDRRADYHDPVLPPRHGLLAFGFWLQEQFDALVHLGAHGTLEWLPGKAAALTPACFPQTVLGALPVIYPFIVSNPGEAAQAKRRIAGITLGHLPPPLVAAGLSESEARLERLVDEYAAADGLDPRRRERLARLIVDTARESDLARHAGVDAATDADEALKRIDAWLCDLKDLGVKDGQHVFGASSSDPDCNVCGAAERAALLTALDARHVAAGPAGAPARGRRDVIPTGRNLFTADPRNLPTPTACDLGGIAADEVIRSHLQEHGDYPRAVVIDLWGSATLRTGGEEIAQGLRLMGCRPLWDAGSGRVTGVEVLPPAAIGRPRVDVTWRVSGLFRDIFPAQIALIDAAARAVAAREDEADDNPLAASVAAGEDPARIFGSAPGTYGAGIEDQLTSGAFTEREDLGRAYLDASSFAFGGAEGEARPSSAFRQRVASADALLHMADDPGRDLLEGSADVAFIGGFAAAAASLGKAADLVVLDTSNPHAPRARRLPEALARLVHGRVSRRFIAGQMRHGPRGAAELAETVDRLVGFAETTHAVSGDLLDRLHAAYLGDPEVLDFLLRENGAAARAMARRFEDARRRGLWHPRRNDVDGDLAALRAEAAQ